MEIKKYILLNMGSETRRAFMEGIPNGVFESYRSKETLLHIGREGTVTFLYKNVPIDFTDSYVFTRLRATDPHFCGMMYEYFTENNIPANDPINRSHPYSAEKISQMLLLSLAGIRVPETLIFREESYKANRTYIMNHVTFPLVYKTDGSKGRNVHIAHTAEELDTFVLEKRPYRLALVQPFIENTFDTRTLVAYGEILGTIKRTRASGYLNNIAQGAVASHYELTESEKEVARASALATRIDFGGVDMIHTNTGPIVLEVNKGPQIAGFESVHPFKVFTKIATLIREKFGR